MNQRSTVGLTALRTTIDYDAGVVNICANANTVAQKAGMTKSWGEARNGMGMMLAIQAARFGIQRHSIDAATTKINSNFNLGAKVEIDWDFTNKDSFHSQVHWQPVMMNFTNGSDVNDIVKTLCEAVAIVSVHPVSRKALMEQVDVISLQMDVTDDSPKHHAFTTASSVSLSERTLIVKMNMASLIPTHSISTDPHTGHRIMCCQPDKPKEWAIEMECVLGATLAKAKAIGESDLQKLSLNQGIAVQFNIDWEKLYACPMYTEVASRQGKPRTCLSLIRRLVDNLCTNLFHPSIEKFVATNSVGQAALQNHTVLLNFDVGETTNPVKFGGSDVSYDASAGILNIAMTGIHNITVAERLNVEQWGSRFELGLNILEAKCRLLCSRNLQQAESTLTNRLGRTFPIVVDSLSFLRDATFLSLPPWQQYTSLTSLILDVPAVLVSSEKDGLMAMAKHDCGKERLNEGDVKGGMKIVIDATNGQSNDSSVRFDSSDLSLCVTINLNLIMNVKKKSGAGGAVETLKCPNNHVLQRLRGNFCCDSCSQSCDDAMDCRECNWGICNKCVGNRQKKMKAVVFGDTARDWKAITDWRARMFLLFDMVVTLARVGCKSKTDTIKDTVSSYFNTMPVSVNWSSFVKSDEFLAFSAEKQTNTTTTAATTLLSTCLVGEKGFSNNGLGFCFFPQVRDYLKTQFNEISFQIHPSSDVEGNIKVSVESNTLIVHVNLSAVVNETSLIPIGLTTEHALSPSVRIARQAAVVEESNVVLQQGASDLGQYGLVVSVDWSFVGAFGDDYVTIVRECAQHSKLLLSSGLAGYHELSIAQLALTCTELASTLKSSVTKICISGSAEQHDTFDVKLNGDEMKIVFKIEDRTKQAGVARAVLHCLCSSVAKDHDTKRQKRINVFDKWQSDKRKKSNQLSEQEKNNVAPLNDKKNEVEKKISDKKQETRTKKSAVRQNLEKQWLDDWYASTPSMCKNKHSKLCNSSSDWYMCTNGCGRAWW